MAYRCLLLVSTLWLGACSWFAGESTRPENPVIRGVNYVGVTVSDVSQSSQLYEQSADLQVVSNEPLLGNPILAELLKRDDINGTSRLVRSANAQLNLMAFEHQPSEHKHMSPVAVHGPGIAHVCYQVNQTTEAYQKFLSGGAQPIGEPEMVLLNPKRPVYYAYAHDPDQIMFEVEHVDVAALDLPNPPKHDYRIRHVSISTPDMDRLIAFYKVLLEEENPRRIGRLLKISGDKVDAVSGLAGSELEMAWFQIRNLELELIQYHSHPTELPAQPRPLDAIGYNAIVFDVADMNAARQKLIDAGGSLVIEPTPYLGGQIMYGRDVDGNLLGFQVLPDDSVYSSQNFVDNGI